MCRKAPKYPEAHAASRCICLSPFTMIMSVCKTVKACQGLCLQQFVSRFKVLVGTFSARSHFHCNPSPGGHLPMGLCTERLLHSVVLLGVEIANRRSLSLSFSFSNLTRLGTLPLAGTAGVQIFGTRLRTQ